MKILWFGYILILSEVGVFGDLITALNQIEQRGPSDSLRQMLENLKKQMPCGFPEYGIPPLAPFKSEYQEIILNEKFANGFINLHNLLVQGLDDYVINDISFSIFTLKATFDVNFKKISAFGQYLMDVIIPQTMQIIGDGDLNFSVKDLRFKGNIKLVAKLSGVQIKDFNIVVSLGEVKSNITGLAGGGTVNEILNRIIERLVMDIVKVHEKDISQKIYNFVVPLANEQLKQYSLADIIRMITSPGEPKECIVPSRYLWNLLLKDNIKNFKNELILSN